MATIQIRNPCNQYCIYCENQLLIRSGKVAESTDDEIKKQIDEAAKKDTRIYFTGGGEPTLKKNLPDLIKYAKGLGVNRVGLETNGVLLSYKYYTHKLKEAGLDFCIISLHSHLSHISDRITQMEGGYDYTMKGIDNLRDEGIEIEQILHTILKYNYKDLIKFLAFCENRIGVKIITLTFIRPLKGDTKSEEATPKFSEIEPYVKEAFKYAEIHNLHVHTAQGLGIPLCYMGGYEHLSGDLIRFVYEGKKELERLGSAYKKEKSPLCDDCGLNEGCSGAAESYANLYGLSELRPVKADLREITRKVAGTGVPR